MIAGAKFNECASHSLAEIDLKVCKPHISPAVYLYDMVSTTVLHRLNGSGICTQTRDIYIARTLHMQCSMWPDMVIFLAPGLQLCIHIFYLVKGKMPQ